MVGPTDGLSRDPAQRPRKLDRSRPYAASSM